jgi:hypothetical protein
MPIKWNISAKAMKARGIMDEISREYDSFIEDGAEHLGDVKALRSQVSDMHSDLHAAANVMGNGGGSGSAGEAVDSLKPASAVIEPPAPKSILDGPGEHGVALAHTTEAGLNQPDTFR